MNVLQQIRYVLRTICFFVPNYMLYHKVEVLLDLKNCMTYTIIVTLDK